MAKKSQGKSVYFFTLEIKKYIIFFFEHFFIFFRAFRTKSGQNPDKSGQIRTCPDLNSQNTNEKIENSKTKVFLKFRKLKSNPGKFSPIWLNRLQSPRKWKKPMFIFFFYVKKKTAEMEGTSDFKDDFSSVLQNTNNSGEKFNHFVSSLRRRFRECCSACARISRVFCIC